MGSVPFGAPGSHRGSSVAVWETQESSPQAPFCRAESSSARHTDWYLHRLRSIFNAVQLFSQEPQCCTDTRGLDTVSVFCYRHEEITPSRMAVNANTEAKDIHSGYRSRFAGTGALIQTG